MKRLIFFLAVLILIGLSGAAVYFSGLIFDATRKIDIDPYIFQPAELSQNRIGRPVELERMSDERVLEHLIERFVREYLNVIPDADDVTRRGGVHGPLRFMASRPVFENWNANVRPQLSQLASTGKLRRAHVTNLRTAGDFHVVTYDLITYNSNDIGGVPEIRRNREMQLRLRPFESGVRETFRGEPFDAGRHLRNGGDPAVIFKFLVEEVR